MKDRVPLVLCREDNVNTVIATRIDVDTGGSSHIF